MHVTCSCWVPCGYTSVLYSVCFTRHVCSLLRLNLPLFTCSPTSVSNHCFYQHSSLTAMWMCLPLCVCLHTNVYCVKAGGGLAIRVRLFDSMCSSRCEHLPLIFWVCARLNVKWLKEKTHHFRKISSPKCSFVILCMHMLTLMFVHALLFVFARLDWSWCLCVWAHVCGCMWKSIWSKQLADKHFQRDGCDAVLPSG